MRWRWRRGTLAAAGLVAMLTVSVMMARDGDVSPAGTRAGAPTQPAGQAASLPVSDLRLELLRQPREELTQPERDPFRFQARQAPAGPSAPAPAAPPSAPVVARPAGPAGPPPPISLRFIGLVDAPSQAGRVAILSDGRGNIVYGKEGDILEGRYRLLKVGPEAVELAYVDGRGRQTVRLAGQ